MESESVARRPALLADLNAGKVAPAPGFSANTPHWQGAAMTGKSHFAYRISYPPKTSSRPGDHGQVRCTAELPPRTDKALLRFTAIDSYDGSLAGYHFKQALVNAFISPRQQDHP